MAALSTGLDHPSPGSHCLILLFSTPYLFPAHHFCCTAPPPMHPCPSPPGPGVSWSLHHLRVLIQVPATCPSLRWASSECLPPSNMLNLPLSPFLSLLLTWKTHFYPFPISVFHLSCPCPTASLGLSWQLKSIFQLIFYFHFFLISLSIHDPSLPCPLLLFPFPFSPVFMWQSTPFPPPSLVFYSFC